MKISRVFNLLFLLAALANLSGCLEASLELSPESRLPKWFAIPTGSSRSDFTVTMDYYSTFNGGESVFKLYKKGSFFRLQKVTGIPHFPYSRELKSPPPGFPKGYPLYAIITADGVTDVLEQRGKEPIFYMCDDPAVWKELGVDMK